MTELWARIIEPTGQTGSDYWNYFAQRLVELANIPEEAVVLDIGTDNGNVLFKAMDKAGPRSQGVGIDIDYRGFVEGLTELRNRRWGNVAFAQMDANSLGFAHEKFHYVLGNFIGWDDIYDFDRMEFKVSDRRTADILRVLKPGGQVGVGFWIEQADIDWIAEAFRRHLPEHFATTWYSISSYSKENTEGYQVILRSGGFGDIRVHIETTPLVLPDEEAWWRQMKIAAREYFTQVIDPAELDRFKEKIFSELQQFRSAEGIQFSKTVAYVFGAK
jgi:ubiquinone/menaquinone biosynthesis C-methylase UbiE